MATYTDDFNRANETPLSSPWSGIGGGTFSNVNLISNKANNASSSNAAAYYNGALTNDQYTKITVSTSASYAGGPLCRVGTDKFYWFGALRNSPGVLYLWNSGFTLIANLTGSNWVDGIVAKLVLAGTTLKPYVDGSASSTGTDSTLASGYGGIRANFTAMDDFECGDGDGTPVGHPAMARWGGVPFVAVNRGVW